MSKPNLMKAARRTLPYSETREFQLTPDEQPFSLTLTAVKGATSGRIQDFFEHLVMQYMGDAENGVEPTLVPPIVENEDGTKWGIIPSKTALLNCATLMMMQSVDRESDLFDERDWLIMMEVYSSTYNQIKAFASEVAKKANFKQGAEPTSNTLPHSAPDTTSHTRKSSKGRIASSEASTSG